MAILGAPRQRIQHLLRRAGFGYRADELEQYVALGLEGSVDRLLHPEQIDDSALDALLAPVLAPFGLNFQDKEVDQQQRQALLRAWYIRMTYTRRPLQERMTYFWHDHFATAISKVEKAALMQRQNDTLRANALGSFRDLLLGMARDPAMLIYLDNRTNVKGRPNENYARELLELHTLGEGNGYTENDIHEAARALTGWRLADDGSATYRAAQHDDGRKTIFGVTANFDDASLVKLLAEKRGTAEYIADKLVRYFVQPDGDETLTALAADTFAQSGGSIRDVMRVILLSEHMYSDDAYRAIVKSPTELLVGAKRALEVNTAGTNESDFGNRLGQLLFNPPNPAGWTGGADWINAATVLTRSNFASDLASLKSKTAADIPALLRRYGATKSASAVVDWTLDLLIGGNVERDSRQVLIDHIGGEAHFNFEQAARDGLLHGMVYLALSMPLYQVA